MQTKTQAVSQQQNQTTLPPFKDVIKVEVSVQDIFKKLLGEFPEDYKHKEMVAHAIVGSAFEKGGLDYIYNALNGYPIVVDFEVGDEVMCTEKDRTQWYDANVETEKGEIYAVPKTDGAGLITEQVDYKPKWAKRSIEIGRCKVKQINLYRSDKLLVTFEGESRYTQGKTEEYEVWVNHTQCTKWAVESVAV